MGIVLDSTLFVDLARRRPGALRKADELDARRAVKLIPTPVIYEISAGILRAKSRTQEALFWSWITRFQVAPPDLPSAESAAVLRAEMIHAGRVDE